MQIAREEVVLADVLLLTTRQIISPGLLSHMEGKALNVVGQELC